MIIHAEIKRHLEQNQKHRNAGASNEDIQTAALTLIAEQLVTLVAPDITDKSADDTDADG